MKLSASSRFPVSLHPLRAASSVGAVLLVLLSLPDLVSGHAQAQQEAPPEAESAETPALASPAVGAAPEPADAPTAREKELLEKIRRLKAPRLRRFGACQYDWTAWRLSAKGVRTTNFRCGEPPITGNVAVFCPSLRISDRSPMPSGSHGGCR